MSHEVLTRCAQFRGEKKKLLNDTKTQHTDRANTAANPHSCDRRISLPPPRIAGVDGYARQPEGGLSFRPRRFGCRRQTKSRAWDGIAWRTKLFDAAEEALFHDEPGSSWPVPGTTDGHRSCLRTLTYRVGDLHTPDGGIKIRRNQNRNSLSRHKEKQKKKRRRKRQPAHRNSEAGTLVIPGPGA